MSAESDAGRDAILGAAIKRHNLLYGNDHCDRKYILSCRRLPEIILSLPKPKMEAPMPDAARAAHDIEVAGRWHNDSTAGVYVWCNTCDHLVIAGDDFGDRLTPAQIAEAVTVHTAPPPTCTERGCFADDPPCYSDPSCARVTSPAEPEADR